MCSFRCTGRGSLKWIEQVIGTHRMSPFYRRRSKVRIAFHGIANNLFMLVSILLFFFPLGFGL